MMNRLKVERINGGSRFTSATSSMVLVIGLLGCASSSTPVSPDGTAAAVSPSTRQVGGGAEIVTASDETDVQKRARLRFELAVNYFELGQTTVALDELKQVLNLDPNFANAYNLRGLIYMRLNDNRLAEESFRRALALSPQDSSALHNYGWFLCQRGRYPESLRVLSQALANPMYLDRAKTLLAQGLCEARDGRREDAERTLAKAYELDAANPVTGYNLALLLYLRGDVTRAQFYIRRINNSEQANAESLWLGIRIERRLKNPDAELQLASQLKRRFPQTKEAIAYERGAFDD
jgi:type IV pilus assembly protein PilF